MVEEEPRRRIWLSQLERGAVGGEQGQHEFTRAQIKLLIALAACYVQYICRCVYEIFSLFAMYFVQNQR